MPASQTPNATPISTRWRMVTPDTPIEIDAAKFDRPRESAMTKSAARGFTRLEQAVHKRTVDHLPTDSAYQRLK